MVLSEEDKNNIKKAWVKIGNHAAEIGAETIGR